MMDDSPRQAAPGDADLIRAAGSGDATAFAMLRERHVAAVRTLTGLLCPDSAESEQVVADTFARLRSVLRDGGGPKVALRPYLVTSVRWAAYARLTSGGRVRTQDLGEPLFADPAAADLVRSPLNRAFMSLPEQYRAVLWHRGIERGDTAQTKVILGLDEYRVAQVSEQARAGLIQACLSGYVSGAASRDCASALSVLAAADGALTGQDGPAVRQHLRGCPLCRAVVDELDDIDGSLRRIVAPLFLGVAAMAYLAAVETTVGGLRWARSGARRGKHESRRRYILAVSAVVLAAFVATGITLNLTANASPQRVPPNPLTAVKLPATPTPALATPTPTPGASPTPTPTPTRTPAKPAPSRTPTPGAGPTRTSAPAPTPKPVPTRRHKPPRPIPTLTSPGPTPTPAPTATPTFPPPF